MIEPRARAGRDESEQGHSPMVDPRPWQFPWPTEELEFVPACPVCGNVDREILHESLRDNIFFVALGLWTMYRCTRCRSGYLDPRPSKASIGQAYGSYYTHVAETPIRASIDQLNFLDRARRVLANGYLNIRFGTARSPASKLGIHLLRLFPTQRETLDSEFRFLPRPNFGHRLLDIGCGNGAFLAKATSAGWAVVGIDFDPKAVEATREQGFDARVGAIDLFAGESNCFDAVTLSHVVEHVHDPIALLNDISRLLKPGGVLYVETPNIESLGSRIYRENWRGIEAPRHLVLFNHESLNAAMVATGFEVTRSVSKTNVAKGIFLQSANMSAGVRPLEKNTKVRWVDRVMLTACSSFKTRNEFITLVARKRHDS